mgnify:CR=1 FL=1
MFKKLIAKYGSRKFLLTAGAHVLSGYLASQGHVEAAAALSSVAQGTYNLGQGYADGATAKDELIKMAVDKAITDFAKK